MKFDDLTIGEVRELCSMFGGGAVEKPQPFREGTAYLIRTVTMIVTGRVQSRVGDFIVLEDAAWIADTGRYYDALKSGVFKEVEPYPNGAILHLGAIVDATIWTLPLPKEQK